MTKIYKFIIVFLIMLNIECYEHQSREHNQRSIKILTPDEVISAPEKYKGTLAVSGTVIKIDESKNTFLLGCEDACLSLPVEYQGPVPEVNSNVIVYGEIKRQENGKYIFLGKEVKKK